MKYLILSVDTGIDDALALAYAVGQQELKLIGVTVSYGMAPVEYTYRNTKHVLSLLGAQDVPVYAGSKAPVQEKRSYNGDFHGMDGAANLLGAPSPAQCPRSQDMDAVTFLLEAIGKYKEQVILVTTGPLTDLAAAIQKDPETMKQVGHVYSMGGALTCPGNSSPYGEANIKADPLSSKIAAQSRIPITFIGLDVTRKTLLTQKEITPWKSYGTSAGTYFYKLLSFYIKEYHKFYPYLDGCALHDPLAAACACFPELIKAMPFSLTVSLDEKDKGRLTENIQHPDPEPQTHVALMVDSQKFKQHFLKVMENILRSECPPPASLYIAGPMLFYPDGDKILSDHAALCQRKNLLLPSGRTPLLDTDSPSVRAQKHRMRCLESLSESKFILADLTPFRGSQPDSGTLFELGYAFGKGKNCGYFCGDPSPWMAAEALPHSFEEALDQYFLSPKDWIRQEGENALSQDHCLVFSRILPETLAASPVLWIKPDLSPKGRTLFEQLFPPILQEAADRSRTAFVDLSFFQEDGEPCAQASFLCGYLYAKEKPFYILSNDLRSLREKLNGTFMDERGCWVDTDGNMIEDFFLPVNLMLATTASGFEKIET